tara:strand:- start:739 stop:1278 length:540 start_codon:yes stop_codon:yes gene_type:complete
MPYASGKRAFGISDRSGFRYRLRDMKKEWTGSLVGPDEFESKHPQLTPPKVYPDPQALRDARPEPNLVEERSIQHGFNPVGFRDIIGLTPLNNLAPIGEVGDITITITPFIGNTANVTGVQGASAIGTVDITVPDEDENVNVTGVSATSAVGSTTISAAPSFDSTVVTLDSTTDTFDEG